MKIITKTLFNTIFLSFGLVGSLAVGGTSENRVARANLDTGDKFCNHRLDPPFLKLERFEEVDVEISVPKNSSLLGWRCEKEVCRRTLVGTKNEILTLLVDNGDPRNFGSATFALVVYSASGSQASECEFINPHTLEAETQTCFVPAAPCNSCPCDPWRA